MTRQTLAACHEADLTRTATVVGLARSSTNGQATDAHQWLVNVTLLRE